MAKQNKPIKSLKPKQVEYFSASFFRIFLNATYFLGISPFRLVKETVAGSNYLSLSNTYTSKSWLPQLILAFCGTTLGTIWKIRDLRFSAPTNFRNPAMYFQTMQIYASTLEKLIFLKLIWFNKSRILEVVNFGSNLKKFRDNPPQQIPFNKYFKFAQAFTIIACFLYAMCSCMEVITGEYTGGSKLHENINDTDVSTNSKRTVGTWWIEMVDAGYTNFFLSNSSQVSQEWEEDTTLTIEDHIIGILSVVGLYYRYVYFLILKILPKFA